MAKTIDEVTRKWSPARKARVARQSEALIKEYNTLQAIRKAHDLTQKEIAETLGVTQVTVSKLEKRSDILISTLRDYVGAMGGELQVTAVFPGQPPMFISSLHTPEASGSPVKPNKVTKKMKSLLTA